MSLWNLQELQQLGRLVPDSAMTDITDIAIDSRQLEGGELFIALSGDPGPRFNGGVENPRDGHDFIDAAIDGGAAVILLSRPPANISVPYVQVEDTLDGLWDLARLARQRCQGKVVAITGSAGKTTAKTWLSESLNPLCKVHSSVGSLNNHWGVPLSLSRMPADTQVGVIEIGTNHAGEISPLSSLARPDVSLLLNVLPAHIGNFASIEALRTEKLAIADGLTESGVMILPTALASGGSREITFGLEPDADATATYTVSGTEWVVQANVCGEQLDYRLNEGGEHRVLTSLAVLAVASQLGYAVGEVASHLAHVDSPKGRGNKTEIDGITVVDDSYNANPISMVYAINSLENRGRKIALLGEMLELGDDNERYHRQVAEHFSELDQVITVGEGFEVCPGAQHFSSITELDLDDFVKQLKPGDQLLVKGSNKVFWKHQFVDKLIAKLSVV